MSVGRNATGRRRAAVVGVVGLMAAASLTSCQVVKLGARCKTNELQHDGGAWIMKCEGGRWRRALTKADAARLLLSLQTTTTTTTAAPPAPDPAPPTTAALVVPTTAAPTTTTTTVPPRNDELDGSYGNSGVSVVSAALAGSTTSRLNDARATAAGIYLIFSAQFPSSPGPLSSIVVRLTPGGVLDTSFSGDGLLPLPAASSVTVDAAGRVYSVVSGPGLTTVVRRTAVNGSPDTAFGTGGDWAPTIGAGCNGLSLALTPVDDGSVVGSFSTVACGLVHVAPNGTAGAWGDLSSLGNANVGGVQAGPGNTVYVRTGSSMSFPTASDRILRLTATGAVDTTFGTNGTIDTTNISGVSYPTTMSILRDGSMLFSQALGFSFDAATSTTVRRLLPSGAIDTSGAFTGGVMNVSGHLVTPLPSGGFAVSWWQSASSASHRAYTATGGAGTAFGGSDRMRFDGGLWNNSVNVISANRFFTVVDRGTGHVDVYKFAPPVS